jgi:hypothetical protein
MLKKTDKKKDDKKKKKDDKKDKKADKTVRKGTTESPRAAAAPSPSGSAGGSAIDGMPSNSELQEMFETLLVIPFSSPQFVLIINRTVWV